MSACINFNSAEEKKINDSVQKKCYKKIHRSKKKLPGRKQRLRQKLKLQSELAKQQLRLTCAARSAPSIVVHKKPV